MLILAAIVSVVFGLAAAQGFRQSDGALQRAEANTAQLVRIQAIHTNLVARTPTPPTPSWSAVWSRPPSASTSSTRSRPPPS